jgi:ribose 5-phosphate isomerase B
MTRIAIACDHGGVALKNMLISYLATLGAEEIDLGTDSTDSVDYPDYAHKLADCLLSGEAATGILICGSGIGISMAANRHHHVRAALCHDVTGARLAREHNDANVLVLGARTTGAVVAQDILATFLNTAFEGERHLRRLGKINPGT